MAKKAIPEHCDGLRSYNGGDKIGSRERHEMISGDSSNVIPKAT